MMECPDIFALGDKWVLLGSLFSTNQWWVGSLQGLPPRFVPEQVGILDYGNGYAAKSGSSMIATNNSRRVQFAFTGWNEPTMPPKCGRNLVIPRELRVVGSKLWIEPIPEVAVLRNSSSHRRTVIKAAAGVRSAAAGTLASGSQVEIRLNCSLPLPLPRTGKIAVRTLATADESNYTEIGYDFANQSFYADHSRCCAAASDIIQRAPLPLDELDGVLTAAVLVDGGVIEAFSTGLAISPLVSPDPAAAAETDRVSSVVTTVAGAVCQVDSWQLAY